MIFYRGAPPKPRVTHIGESREGREGEVRVDTNAHVDMETLSRKPHRSAAGGLFECAEGPYTGRTQRRDILKQNPSLKRYSYIARNISWAFRAVSLPISFKNYQNAKFWARRAIRSDVSRPLFRLRIFVLFGARRSPIPVAPSRTGAAKSARAILVIRRTVREVDQKKNPSRF